LNSEVQPPLLPHERALRAGVLAVLLLALGILIAKATSVPVPAMPCGFRNLSGLPCAMCGGTRAASSLIGGDWTQAFYWNAMALPVLAGMLITAAICLIEWVRGSALIDWNPLRKRLGKLLPVTLTLLAAWWVLHVFSALKTPKVDLIDLKNPIAAAVASFLGIR
jgi:hypothetical protein